MSFEFYLIFTVTVFLTSIIPGPSMFLALTHGIKYGVKRTVFSALGNVTATLLQALISIVGLGALLIASETAFEIIKWLGAGYLFYMGISMLRASRLSTSDNEESVIINEVSNVKLYFQSFFVTAGNPKAIIFFGAIFPQFLVSSAPIIPQAILLVGICALTAFFSFMVYAVGGYKVSNLFSTDAFRRYMQRIAGGTFISYGLVLAASNSK